MAGSPTIFMVDQELWIPRSLVRLAESIGHSPAPSSAARAAGARLLAGAEAIRASADADRLGRVRVPPPAVALRVDATGHPGHVRPVPLRTLPRYLLTGRFLQIFAHLPQFARLYFRLFRDRRVPMLAKAWLVLVLLYLVSPIDLVPAWFAVIGQLDDLLIVSGGLWLFVRLCPPAVVREHVLTIGAEARR